MPSSCDSSLSEPRLRAIATGLGPLRGLLANANHHIKTQIFMVRTAGLEPAREVTPEGF
jgi:hypothetical protein